MKIKINKKIKIILILFLVLIIIQFLAINFLYKIAFEKIDYIWLMPMTLSKGYYTSGSMFDTFDNHIIIRTNNPVYLYVLNTSQFINFANGKNFSSLKTLNGKYFNFWFNLSSGCDNYMYVINAVNNTTIIYPDITAIYHPSYLTGDCKESITKLIFNILNTSLK